MGGSESTQEESSSYLKLKQRRAPSECDHILILCGPPYRGRSSQDSICSSSQCDSSRGPQSSKVRKREHVFLSQWLLRNSDIHPELKRLGPSPASACNPAFCQCIPSSMWMLKYLGICHLLGRPRWSSQLLSLVWLHPGCYRYMGSKSVDRQSLCLPPFQTKKWINK